MKRLFKFLWLYLKLDAPCLSQNEKILKFCASDPRFSPDRLGPYSYYFTFLQGGAIHGFITCQKSTWICCFGDDLLNHRVKTVQSLCQLRKLLKPYSK
jgi:hypothetical protein